MAKIAICKYHDARAFAALRDDEYSESKRLHVRVVDIDALMRYAPALYPQNIGIIRDAERAARKLGYDVEIPAPVLPEYDYEIAEFTEALYRITPRVTKRGEVDTSPLLDVFPRERSVTVEEDCNTYEITEHYALVRRGDAVYEVKAFFGGIDTPDATGVRGLPPKWQETLDAQEEAFRRLLEERAEERERMEDREAIAALRDAGLL